ncbi:hypothetical protein ACIRBX_00260 [Kitasatospora sp. NPDC096147]|uniref:hypothetical protein n=1 Tax=Kitasatospora sp. NPDC096147 TaxID=3364093 RepID=UPI00381E19A9
MTKYVGSSRSGQRRSSRWAGLALAAALASAGLVSIGAAPASAQTCWVEVFYEGHWIRVQVPCGTSTCTVEGDAVQPGLAPRQIGATVPGNGRQVGSAAPCA